MRFGYLTSVHKALREPELFCRPLVHRNNQMYQFCSGYVFLYR